MNHPYPLLSHFNYQFFSRFIFNIISLSRSQKIDKKLLLPIGRHHFLFHRRIDVFPIFLSEPRERTETIQANVDSDRIIPRTSLFSTIDREKERRRAVSSFTIAFEIASLERASHLPRRRQIFLLNYAPTSPVEYLSLHLYCIFFHGESSSID